MRLRKTDWPWLAIAGVVTILELDHQTQLSGLTRRLFRVDTDAGRIAFVGSWLGFAGWFTWHIAYKKVEGK